MSLQSFPVCSVADVADASQHRQAGQAAVFWGHAVSASSSRLDARSEAQNLHALLVLGNAERQPEGLCPIAWVACERCGQPRCACVAESSSPAAPLPQQGPPASSLPAPVSAAAQPGSPAASLGGSSPGRHSGAGLAAGFNGGPGSSGAHSAGAPSEVFTAARPQSEALPVGPAAAAAAPAAQQQEQSLSASRQDQTAGPPEVAGDFATSAAMPAATRDNQSEDEAVALAAQLVKPKPAQQQVRRSWRFQSRCLNYLGGLRQAVSCCTFSPVQCQPMT